MAGPGPGWGLAATGCRAASSVRRACTPHPFRTFAIAASEEPRALPAAVHRGGAGRGGALEGAGSRRGRLGLGLAPAWQSGWFLTEYWLGPSGT